jgi:hypothetical protein
MASLPNLMPRRASVVGRPGRIDRLGWSAGTCVRACGWSVGVRVNEPALLAQLAACLPPGWRPAVSPDVDAVYSLWAARPRGGATGRNRVYAGSERRASTPDLGHALAVLESEIRLGLALGARGRTFVHAGAVGWRGRAILVPGRSRSGKTTLVAELVRQGALYLSDEFAVLDARGRVHPFTKPLSIRGAGGCDAHARRQTVEDLGGRSARRPLPVGLVAFTEYHEAAAWEPVPLSAGAAVLELLAHTVPARLRPAESLHALARATSRAALLKGPRGDAAEAAARLLDSVAVAWPQADRPPGGGR